MTDRNFVECHVEEICLPSKYGNESLVVGGLISKLELAHNESGLNLYYLRQTITIPHFDDGGKLTSFCPKMK
ncbi:hypothetical protein ACHAWX_006848 [Stephanocyclus meneghinianus]